MLPVIDIIIISRRKNIWLFRFTYLFLTLFIWKSFIKRIAVCCFLRSHIIVRISRIIFLASPPEDMTASTDEHILQTVTGFTTIHPSNIYLVDNFLNIAYAKNQVFLVFKVVSLRFFPNKTVFDEILRIGR